MAKNRMRNKLFVITHKDNGWGVFILNDELVFVEIEDLNYTERSLENLKRRGYNVYSSYGMTHDFLTSDKPVTPEEVNGQAIKSTIMDLVSYSKITEIKGAETEGLLTNTELGKAFRLVFGYSIYMQDAPKYFTKKKLIIDIKNGTIKSTSRLTKEEKEKLANKNQLTSID